LHMRVHSRGREGQGYSGGGCAAVVVVVAATAAARAAAARAEAAHAEHEAVCAQPRVRTLNTANHNGWQRGERLVGRDAVQQRVAGADKADEADDEAFVLGTTADSRKSAIPTPTRWCAVSKHPQRPYGCVYRHPQTPLKTYPPKQAALSQNGAFPLIYREERHAYTYTRSPGPRANCDYLGP
jgi:hypothetical protein